MFQHGRENSSKSVICTRLLKTNSFAPIHRLPLSLSPSLSLPPSLPPSLSLFRSEKGNFEARTFKPSARTQVSCTHKVSEIHRYKKAEKNPLLDKIRLNWRGREREREREALSWRLKIDSKSAEGYLLVESPVLKCEASILNFRHPSVNCNPDPKTFYPSQSIEIKDRLSKRERLK